jgi:hypothetical protein
MALSLVTAQGDQQQLLQIKVNVHGINGFNAKCQTAVGIEMLNAPNVAIPRQPTL